jgi:ABC-type multidrug transport system ATPase subunit
MQGALDFPNLRSETDGFWEGLGDFFPLLMIISLLFPLSNAIKSLVVEKETRMREGYMIMSLRGDVYWITWIINFFALFLPLSIILTIVGENLFTFSDAVFIFFYFFLFFMASMSYCILISVFFSKSKSASIIGSLVFFAGYFIYVGLATDTTLTRSQLMAACLHPASAFTYGTLAFKEYESSKIGVTRYTYDASNDYNITFIDTLVMQVINFIYMLVLAAYFGEVWPSEYGTSRPWYFPVQPSFWKSKLRCFTALFSTNESFKRVNDSSKSRGSIEMVQTAGAEKTNAESGQENCEAISEDLKAQIEAKRCIQIKNLVKTFDTATGKKVAVDNLSLDVFSGQITALLGHNGAGKTTTISMMTGLIPVTSGTANVCGYDLVEELADIRKMIGYCPQHDVLIGNMTVEEHLYLFANIKGCPPSEVKSEVEKMISGVGLTDKRNDFADNLSGGQKRKLSLAIAFIGKSRIVFLDEPTSGMDPYSRRFTWNVIRKYREGRIIILTTHFMDEADLLGDRIAIMADGRLRCCGSSLYLKQKYGVGYNLTIEKGDAVHFNSKETVKLIKEFVPECAVITDVGTELTLELPFSGSASFERMFDTLEKQSATLGVLSYSISATTLEEVFIRVAAGIAKERGQALTVRKKELESEKASHLKLSGASESQKEAGVVTGESANIRAPSPSASNHVDAEIPFTSIPAEEIEKYGEDDNLMLFFVHFIALFQKRYYYFKRDTKSWAFQYGVPVVFIIIGMIVMRYSAFTTNQPSLTLDPSVYNPDYTSNYFPIPYSAGNVFCYENNVCNNIDGQDDIMQQMPNQGQLPIESQTDATTMYNVSDFLLRRRNDYAAARFGAVSFSTISYLPSGALSYVEYNIHSNFTGVHAGPVTSALVAEAVLKSINPNASVVTRIHPLPETPGEKTRYNSFNTTNVILFILLAIPFIPASFAMFIVREKELKSKHLQLVSGVSIASYWIATWVWDVSTYMITAWLMIMVIAVFPGTELFTRGQSFSGVIALFMLFGTSAPPFAYLCSFFLNQSAGTQTVILFVNFITGLILMIVGIILRLIPSTRDVYMDVIRFIFMLFPAHAFGDGLDSIVIKELWSFYELGGGKMYGVFDLNITGYNLIFMAWESVAYLALVIIIDYVRQTPWLYAKIFRESTPPRTKDEDEVDEDVKAEQDKVLSGYYDTSGPGGTPASVILKNIKKVYPGGNYAVRGVSLAVNNGECFGLLGINGAG